MLRTLAGGLAAALLLMGCAETRASRTASEETLVTATATVESVDQATRQVVLRDDADGTTFAVTAGPEVRNLPQLAAGDRVQLDYYQSLAVAMADPADTGEPRTLSGGWYSAQIDVILERARRRGEDVVEPTELVRSTPGTLLRFHFLAHGAPISDAVIDAIVDEVAIPLFVRGRAGPPGQPPT